MADTATAAAAAAAATAAVVAATSAARGGGGGGGGGSAAVPGMMAGAGGGRGARGGGGGAGGTSIQDSLARQITREAGQNISLGIPPFTTPPPDNHKACFAKHTHYFCLSIPRSAFVAAARSFGDFDVRGEHKEIPQQYEIALSLLGLTIERFSQATYPEVTVSGDGAIEHMETKRQAAVRVFMECVHAKPSVEKKDWVVEKNDWDTEDLSEEEKASRLRQNLRNLGKQEKSAVVVGHESEVARQLDKFLEETVKQTVQGTQSESVHKYDPDKIVLFRIHVLCQDNSVKDTTSPSNLLREAVPEFASLKGQDFMPPALLALAAAADEKHKAKADGEPLLGEAAADEDGKKDKSGEPKTKTPSRRSTASNRQAAGGTHFPYHRVISSKAEIVRCLNVATMLAPHKKGQTDLEAFVKWALSPEIACSVEAANVCDAQAEVDNYTVRGEFPIPSLVAEINDISCFFPRRIATMQWWHLCTGLQPSPSEKQHYASLLKSSRSTIVPYLMELRERERKEIKRQVNKFRMKYSEEKLEEVIGADFVLNERIWNTADSVYAYMTARHRAKVPPPPPPTSPVAAGPKAAEFTAEEEEEAMRQQGGDAGESDDIDADIDGAGLPEAGLPPPPSAAKQKAPPSPAKKLPDIPEGEHRWPDGSKVEDEPDEAWAFRMYLRLFASTEEEQRKSWSKEEAKLARQQLDDFKRFHHERYVREFRPRVYGSSEATFDSLKKINAEKVRLIGDSVKVFEAKLLPEFMLQQSLVSKVNSDVERYYINRYRAHLMADYREKALRVFMDILYRDGKLSPASRAVVEWGLQYLNDPRNVNKNFSRPHNHVLPPTDKNEGMSAFASFIVGKMREFEHVLEVCKTHSTCLLAWLSCLHVHADTPFHPNLLLDGEYASGKSFVMLLMLRLLIPGVVKDISWMTGKALGVEGDFNDEVHLHQEVHPAMLGIGKTATGGLDPQTSSVKNAMTSGVQEVKSLVIDPVTGKRSQVTTKTQCSTVYIVALNLKEGCKAHEIPPAVRSRYAMFFIERMGKEALDLLIRSKGFQGPRYEPVITNSCRIHYLVWFILKLQWTGVLPPTNLDAASHFMHRSLSLAADNDVVAAAEKRNAERLLFLCNVCTILNAITKYFDLPGSPVSKKPWQPRDILGIGPLLVCDVEIAAFVQKLNAFQFEHPHRHTVIEALRKSRFPADDFSKYFLKNEDDGEDKNNYEPWNQTQNQNQNQKQAGGSSSSSKSSIESFIKSKEVQDEDHISAQRKRLYMYSDLVPTQSHARRGRGGGGGGGGAHTRDKEDRAYRPGEPKRNTHWSEYRDGIKFLTVVLHQNIPTVSTKEISDVLYQLRNEVLPVELGTVGQGLDEMKVWTHAQALDFEGGQIKCATRLFETAYLDSRLDASMSAVLENQFRVTRRLISGKLEKGTYHVFKTEVYKGTAGEIKRTNVDYMLPALDAAMALSLPGEGSGTGKASQTINIRTDIDDYEARQYIEQAGWCDPDLLLSYLGPGISPIPTEYLVDLNKTSLAIFAQKGVQMGDYPDVDMKQLQIRRDMISKAAAEQRLLASKTMNKQRRSKIRGSSSSKTTATTTTVLTHADRRDSDITSAEFLSKRRKDLEEMETGRVSARKRQRLSEMLMARPETGLSSAAAASSSSSSSSASSSFAPPPPPPPATSVSLSRNSPAVGGAEEWEND